MGKYRTSLVRIHRPLTPPTTEHGHATFLQEFLHLLDQYQDQLSRPAQVNLVVHPLNMVYCRKEFLKKEVEREHGSAITTTHEGRRHHTRTIAACTKGASRQTQTSADHLAGEPRRGDLRDRHAAQRERADGTQPAPSLQ